MVCVTGCRAVRVKGRVLDLLASQQQAMCMEMIMLMLFVPCLLDRLVDLVVKASASRVEDPGFKSRLRRDFFGVESYQ